jgi:hypothetical protein
VEVIRSMDTGILLIACLFHITFSFHTISVTDVWLAQYNTNLTSVAAFETRAFAPVDMPACGQQVN